jgi:hypothetical protein
MHTHPATEAHPAKAFYSTFEAASLIGVHPAKLVRAYRCGKLAEPGRMLDRRVLTLEDIAEARRVLAPAATPARR